MLPELVAVAEVDAVEVAATEESASEPHTTPGHATRRLPLSCISCAFIHSSVCIACPIASNSTNPKKQLVEAIKEHDAKAKEIADLQVELKALKMVLNNNNNKSNN